MNREEVRLRPITDRDRPFLRFLYASTRQDEVSQTGWPQTLIDSFLAQQFEAQHKSYMDHDGHAEFDLILDPEGAPIGRVYVEERDDEFRLMDISLLPGWRGKGIGGRVIRDILERALGASKAVRLHVEPQNPARRLYQRLGFRKVEDRGIYQFMEALPPPASMSASRKTPDREPAKPISSS